VKKIFFLFGLYLLFLSALPCGDREDCSEAPVAGKSTRDHDHDEDEEHCPPFCVCFCCGFTIEHQQKATASKTPATPFKHLSAAIPARYPQGINAAVWQPPRCA
jgi:hypothetical protein